MKAARKARVQVRTKLRKSERPLPTKDRELAKLRQELSAAREQLIQSEKLAALGELTAGIAHEISTPLSFVTSNMKGLTGYLNDIKKILDVSDDLARLCLGGNGGEEIRNKAAAASQLRHSLNLSNMWRDLEELCRDSVEGVEFLARITSDLREFCRDDRKDLVACNVNILADKAINLARAETEGRVAVKRDYRGKPQVVGIPSRLTQLFLSLIVNAAQAIQGRGTITVATGLETDKVAVTVHDSGTGIRPEHLPRIFEPFFTTKSAGKGTGLGLSIAQKIAIFHGGGISAESELGKGTTIRVTFPRRAGRTPASANRAG